jgi:uncharacterized protein YgiM (DUF1202 family)
MRTPWTWALAAATVAALVGCGDTANPTGVATNPVAQGSGATVSGGPSSSPSSVRTVLSPLGLNIRSDHAVTASLLGTAAEGVQLTVLDHTDQNGGWYKVQGQTISGWITADPSLTAAGQYQRYSSTPRAFSVLYPTDWTFADEPADALFHPIQGLQTIVVRNGTTTADFGAAGATGYVGSGQQTVIVCGVTGDLNKFTRSGAPAPSPTPGTAGPMAMLAQIRLRLDATHALALDFNYAAAADLDVFSAFYNSMTFPYPQCQAPAPSASATPAST